MASKAKIILTNEAFVIVDKTVEDVVADLSAAEGLVEFPVTKKAYNYELNTINIGEKTVPAYELKETTVAIDPSKVVRVEEAREDEAEVNTGEPTIE